MPRRRRRGAVAADVDVGNEVERNFAMRLLLSNPKDMVAGMIAVAAVSAIVANALFMQAGRHPSPMFGPHVVVPLAAPMPVNVLPRPRPAEAGTSPVVNARPAVTAPTPVKSDPVGDLINSSRRAAAVQRTLTEYGYGQLKPTGTIGSDSQAAIQKFERDRKLPVTGQMSDRLVRELEVMTGRSIDQ
jgi:Putative peptidoglycan binding domain